VGPIFDRLNRNWNDDRVDFIRYQVPANQDGTEIIEDLIDRGFIKTREEKSMITGATSTVADMNCLGGTGQICVYDGDTLEYVTQIGSGYSYEGAHKKIFGLLN